MVTENTVCSPPSDSSPVHSSWKKLILFHSDKLGSHSVAGLQSWWWTGKTEAAQHIWFKALFHSAQKSVIVLIFTSKCSGWWSILEAKPQLKQNYLYHWGIFANALQSGHPYSSVLPKGVVEQAEASRHKRQHEAADLHGVSVLISSSGFISNGPPYLILAVLIRGVMHCDFTVLFCIIHTEISWEENEADTGSGAFVHAVNK